MADGARQQAGRGGGGEACEIYNKKKHTLNKTGPRFSFSPLLVVAVPQCERSNQSKFINHRVERSQSQFGVVNCALIGPSNYSTTIIIQGLSVCCLSSPWQVGYVPGACLAWPRNAFVFGAATSGQKCTFICHTMTTATGKQPGQPALDVSNKKRRESYPEFGGKLSVQPAKTD